MKTVLMVAATGLAIAATMPVPAAWALLIGGFGSIAALRRRRGSARTV